MRRSKGQILIDILRYINQKGSAKPTHILYAANLSHKLMKDYLGILMEKGFIIQTFSSDKVRYKITKKGIDYIIEYQKIEKLSSAFGLPI